MADPDEVVTDLVTTFLNQLNSRSIVAELFSEVKNVKCETVYKNGVEIFETAVAIQLATPACTNNGDCSVAIITRLSGQFLFSDPSFRFEKHPHGLIEICVDGKAQNKDGSAFGIFRHFIQLVVDQNGRRNIKNFISKVVCSEYIKKCGRTESTYFEDSP